MQLYNALVPYIFYTFFAANRWDGGVGLIKGMYGFTAILSLGGARVPGTSTSSNLENTGEAELFVLDDDNLSQCSQYQLKDIPSGRMGPLIAQLGDSVVLVDSLKAQNIYVWDFENATIKEVGQLEFETFQDVGLIASGKYFPECRSKCL